MPTVAFPNPLFATSSAVSSASFKDFLTVAPASTPDNTLEVLNGNLEENNLASGVEIQREHVQPGAGVQLSSSSGSINLDYFIDMWGGTDNTFGTGKNQAIPGAGVRFFMPFDGDALIMAQILYMGSIREPSAGSSNWTFFMRFATATGAGTAIGPTRRRIEENLDASNGAHDGTYKLRHYSPHWWAEDLTAGQWYDANLYIVPIQGNADANQVRVWCRNIIAAPMKRV